MRKKIKEFCKEYKYEIYIGLNFTVAVIGGVLIGYSIPKKLTKEGKELLGVVEKAMVGATKYCPRYPGEIGGGNGVIIERDDGQKFNITGAILFGNDVTE